MTHAQTRRRSQTAAAGPQLTQGPPGCGSPEPALTPRRDRRLGLFGRPHRDALNLDARWSKRAEAHPAARRRAGPGTP
jgi:hypothetical protein